MMETAITIVVPVFLSFFLGIYAAAFGARLGKALDSRKELLEGMRDWIDKIQDFTNLLYQNVQGSSNLAWADKDRAELTRYRLSSSARWIGTSKVLGSKELFDATQEFVKASAQFEQLYFLSIMKMPKDDPLFHAKVIELSQLSDQLTNQAEYLHATITQETLSGTPKWLFKKRF